MKRTGIALAISAFSISVMASNTMTIGEKAAAIQSIRNEANQAMNDHQAALDAYNNNRTPATAARLSSIENSLRTAQSRIDSIQSTATAPDAPVAPQQLTPQPIKQLTPPTPQVVQKTPQITGTSYRAAIVSMQQFTTGPAVPTGSINVAVSSLAPSTKVNATINGITTTTTAGELTKVNPQTQVAIPHVDALIVSQRQGSDHSRSNSRSEHGTGNGSNNAANSNSAHGLGGGNHIGGGSAQSGSRSVGHW